MQAIGSSLADPSVNWYLAETVTPVGFVKVTWQCQIPGTSHYGTLLNKLYFSEGTTGKSYGELIFNEIAEMAKERGSDFLWHEVLKENTRARKCYERQGMTFIKNVPYNIAIQHVTLHVLGKSI